MNKGQQVLNKINRLIDIWCDRRCLQPLTYLLGSYPFYREIDEDWNILLEALEEIRGFCANELTPGERSLIDELIEVVSKQEK